MMRESVRVGDLDGAAYVVGVGHGTRRVVGQREHDHPGTVALPSGLAERLLERRRIGNPSGSVGGDWDAPHALARERRLGRVADPRRLGQDDVTRKHRQKGPEQRLAAGGDHDLLRIGGQPTAVEPAGGGSPRARRSRHRAVTVVRGAARERIDDLLRDGQPGFAEGEVEDRLTRFDPAADAFVDRQRRRRRHKVGYRHTPNDVITLSLTSASLKAD